MPRVRLTGVLSHASAHVGQAAFSLLMVLGITFGLMELLPADAASAALGLRQSAVDLASKRDALGLNRPWPARFVSFALGALRGQMGDSLVTGLPVAEGLLRRLPRSLSLVALSASGAVLTAVAISWAQVRWKWSSRLDLVLAPLAAIPPVAVGGTLLLFAAVSPPLAALVTTDEAMYRYPLAAAILVPYPAALLFRTMRLSAAAARRSVPYLASQALGLDRTYIQHTYIFRMVVIDCVAVLTNLLGYYFTALFAVETMLSIGGAALWTAVSARRYDSPVLAGTTLAFSACYVSINMLARIWMLWLDPRSRRV